MLSISNIGIKDQPHFDIHIILRAEVKHGTDFQRVEVLVDNGLNDAGTVVVKKARAGLTKARDELIQSLRNEISS